MRLIIVRHGETDRNINDQLAVADSSKIQLNSRGRHQAESVGRRLAQEKIHVIYSSDMTRARETAEIIAAFLPPTKIVFDRELRERSSGVFSGRPRAEMEKSERESGVSKRDWRPPNGESLGDVKTRAQKWLDIHRVSDAQATVLVVSHGFYIWTLLECAIENGAEVEHERYHHHNTGLTILDVPHDGRATVVHLNDISHLQSN